MAGMQAQVLLSDPPVRGDRGPASSLSQTGKDANEIVQPQQVAVLSVALLPGPPVVQGLAVGEGRGLAEVDEPYASAVAVIMHEEERAADHLPSPTPSGYSSNPEKPSTLFPHRPQTRYLSPPLLPRAS